MIHAICGHRYGICSDIKPEHEMERILFAVDELTGLIWGVAKMNHLEVQKTWRYLV